MPLIRTAGDLIAFALRASSINGVGQTPSAMDSNDGLQLLHDMLAEWKSRRGLVWVLDDPVGVTSTGDLSYTIGPGGQFDRVRPDQIDYARANFANTSGNATLGFPLAIIESREDFNRLSLQGLSTIPRAVFYESTFPMGILHFWPVPPSGEYRLRIGTKTPLPEYTTLADELNVPPVYQRAMRLGLVNEMLTAYGLDVSPAQAASFRGALNVIRMANTQIPEAIVPTFRGRGNGGVAANSSVGFQTGYML